MKTIKSVFLLLAFSMFTTLAFGQEICNNAIDDDGDGLIDLNDADCNCDNFVELVEITGEGCNPIWLTASNQGSDYQWYKDGIAIQEEFVGITGENSFVLKLSGQFTGSTGALDGVYDCIYTESGDCVRTEAYGYLFPEPEELYEEVTICEGEVYVFTVLSGESFNLTESGLFSFNGLSEGCTYTQDILLTVLPAISPDCNGSSTDACNDLEDANSVIALTEVIGEGCKSIRLVASDQGSDYQWFKDGVAIEAGTAGFGPLNSSTLRINGGFGSSSGLLDGSYECLYKSSNNCYRTAPYVYTYPEVEETSLEVMICEDETFEYTTHSGTVYTFTEQGLYSFNDVNEFDCQLIIEIELWFFPSIVTEINEVLCEGEVYVFGGIETTESGTYTATYDSQNGCDSTVIVNLTVKSSISSLISIMETDTVCVNQMEYMIPASLEANEPGKFRFEGPGIIDEDSPIINLDMVAAGINDYMIEFNSEEGCRLDSRAIQIDMREPVGAECLFSSNNDVEALEMKVSPNPAHGQLHVDVRLGDQPTELGIYDLNGILHYSTIVLSESNILDISEMKEGAYIVRLSNGQLLGSQLILIMN